MLESSKEAIQEIISPHSVIEIKTYRISDMGCMQKVYSLGLCLNNVKRAQILRNTGV